MYKKSKKLIVWCLVVSMVLTQMLFTNAAFAASTATRLAGADRIQTAIEISKAGWTSSDYAVIAYSEDFPDALSAAPLAKKYDAPILLNDKTTLSAGVLAELQRLGVKNVFIVGGEGVVSKDVADAIEAAGITVERLAGADRIATSLKVAEKIGTTTEVAVAYSEGFADALSISSIAATKGMPILLTDVNNMTDEVKAYIGDKKAYVIGGTGVVSETVFNGLSNAIRLGGSDRYATNVAVMTQFADELDFGKVVLAAGEDFPDALAGSVYAAKLGAPLVLVYASLMDVTKNFLSGKVNADVQVIALGGVAVVSEAAVNAVAPTVVEPTTLEVESVSAVGLGAIQVVFSQEVDKDSATSLANYQIDGVSLDQAAYTGSKAVLASDNKTVLIMLNNAMRQYSTALFTAKKNVILSKDTLTTVPKFEQVVSFSDTQVPAVKAVTVTGNKKITVEFTEPVLVSGLLGQGAANTFKIDGQYLTNYGFNNATVKAGTATDFNGGTNNGMASKIDLNFSVAIPAGTHELTVPKGSFNGTTLGSGDYLVDHATFKMVETKVNFNVESVTGAPSIVSIEAQTNGEVVVTFDRPMDESSTVTNAASNFYVNTSDAPNQQPAEFKANTNDKVVKLYFQSGVIKEGSNVLVVKKNTVKDAYGNKLDANNDVRISFTAVKDTTKPTVTSVVMLDNQTLRVKFSEKVDASYATNVSNYKIVDSSGQTVTSEYITSSGQFTPATNSDSYSITLAKKLTGSNYSITIKNIQDLASTPNVMDDYTAVISGSDDTNPSIDGTNAVKVSDSKLAVFFDEAMDAASVQNLGNYSYKGGDNNWHSIPASTTIKLGENGKYIIMEFPTGYSVKAAADTTPEVATTANHVQGIRVANVKDLAGNTLSGIIAELGIVSTGTQGPEYVKDSFKLYMNGSSIRAEFELNQTLIKFFANEFKVEGVTPSDGYLSGKKVILNFTSGSNGVTDQDIIDIKAAGKTATLSYVRGADGYQSVNEAGIPIKDTSFQLAGTAMDVYDEQIAPVWKSVQAINVSGTIQLVLTFSEDIDQSRLGDAAGDFVVQAGGTSLSIESVIPNGGNANQVVFAIKNDAAAQSVFTADPAAAITIKAKSLDAYHIYDMKDRLGDQNAWVASSDDKVTGADGILTVGGSVVNTKNTK